MCLSSPFLFSSPSLFISLFYFFAYYFISSHFLSSLHSLCFSFFFSFLPSVLYAALLLPFLFSFFSFSLCLSSPLLFSSHYINHTQAPSIVLRNPEPEHTSAAPLSRRLFPVLKQCPFHGNWRRKEQENIPGLLNFSLEPFFSAICRSKEAGRQTRRSKLKEGNTLRWDSLMKSFPLSMYFSCSSCKHACTCLNTQTHTYIKGPVFFSVVRL